MIAPCSQCGGYPGLLAERYSAEPCRCHDALDEFMRLYFQSERLLSWIIPCIGARIDLELGDLSAAGEGQL